MIRLLVRPDATAASVMDAIVSRHGLAVSERGVVCTAVQVEFCARCENAHPLDLICADMRAAPGLSPAGSR